MDVLHLVRLLANLPLLVSAAALAGLLLTFLGLRGRQRVVRTNSSKGSAVLLVGTLAWLVILGLAFAILPLGAWAIFAFVWFYVGFFAALRYTATHGTYWPQANMLHVPLIVTYWLCYVSMPKEVRFGTSFEIEIGLHKASVDIKLQANSPEELEQIKHAITQGMSLQPPKYGENTLVEGGGLEAKSSLSLRLAGPAFRIEPRSQDVTADELEHRPAKVILYSEHSGDQTIRIDFYFAGSRRGGLTVPIRVETRYVALFGWLWLILRYLGPVLALLASAFLVAAKLKLFQLLPGR